jgi:S1-C subfamily serine protease
MLKLAIGGIALALSFALIGRSAFAQGLPNAARDNGAAVVQIIVSGKDDKGQQSTSIGSGFWVASDGMVATCDHVVNMKEVDSVRIQSVVDGLVDPVRKNFFSANWQIFNGRIIAEDAKDDVALIRVDGPSPFINKPIVVIHTPNRDYGPHYKVAEITSDIPPVGETVTLAGFPLALPYLIFQQASFSTMAVRDGDVALMLISGLANHGNSGGPVFDSKGRVIGLLEGEVEGQDQQRTGIEKVVPSYYLEIMLKKSEGMTAP